MRCADFSKRCCCALKGRYYLGTRQKSATKLITARWIGTEMNCSVHTFVFFPQRTAFIGALWLTIFPRILLQSSAVFTSLCRDKVLHYNTEANARLSGKPTTSIFVVGLSCAVFSIRLLLVARSRSKTLNSFYSSMKLNISISSAPNLV